MTTTLQDIFSLGPTAVVFGCSLVVLLVETIYPRSERVQAWLTLVAFALCLVTAYQTVWGRGTAFNGLVLTGGLSSYFALIFGVVGFLTVMLSASYLRDSAIAHGEYYALVLIAAVGMMLMAGAGDLITLFLGLETMSISFYVLAGFARRRLASNESALKYFLLGAFATGFLLYGIALIFGATGTTSLAFLSSGAATASPSPLLLIGLGLLLVGIGFKVASVPFHMWVPDVYEGAPTTVTAFMSTGGKAAGFSLIVLVFGPGVLHTFPALRDLVAVGAALSMLLGNIVAISQTSAKRMLAYSSIAHAGYLLVGVAAANSTGLNGVLYYLAAYAFMNIGAFGVISMLESKEDANLRVTDLAGLSSRHPYVAALMALFMFSLAGIPPFAGFFGKYYVFLAAIEGGYTWLAILGVIMSVVSAYFYLRLVVLMYFHEESSPERHRIPAMGMVALVVCALSILELGVLPSTVLTLTGRLF
jgi:NADH-quinone oxidoreductase subunit N